MESSQEATCRLMVIHQGITIVVKIDNGRLTQVKEYYEKSCRCWSKLGGTYSVVEGEIFFLGGGGEIFLRGKTQRGLRGFS